MPEAYIVQSLRTAGGRRKGALSGVHPADLGGLVLDALVDRSGIDPAAVEDVIVGCVSQVGEQSFHIARNMVMASKLPDSVPAVGIDRQCGSSQQAIQFAAQAVMSGTQDVVIAAGVESMSRVPMGSPTRLAAEAGLGTPWSDKILKRYGIDGFSQFTGAQMIADKYGFSREAMDAYALASHQKAKASIEAGWFVGEIVPVLTPAGIFAQDEGVRFDASLEAMAAVKPVVEGGTITAANASQMTDGASGALIVSEAALKRYNLTPIARIVNLTVTAGDPVIMLEEPIGATKRALQRAGMKIDDIDAYEVNEAFACVPMAWLEGVGADPAKLNIHGGAIALGHPLGASGTKLMATLLHGLKTHNKRYGLQTMCEGGGIANVTIVERL